MLRTALIGFPSAGKTTLFRLLTGHAEPTGHGRAETTIGVARVPDERLDELVRIYSPRKRVPATIDFADPAAAVGRTGASLVEVAAFRDADALVHVLRGFRDERVPRAEGSVSAARDAQAMEDELVLADLAVAERRLERISRDLKKLRSADLERERELVSRCHAALEQGQPLRTLHLDHEEQKRLRGFQFLSAKPLLLVVNVDESDVRWLSDTALLVDEAGLGPFLERGATSAVGVCAKIELEIAELDKDDASAFLADLGVAESGVDRVIRAAYDLLGYITFFTVGEDECRAWSIPRGTTAQAAAGEIHSDMARGFIRAEVVPYERLAARGSMHACREHGEVRLEGKDYIVADGDVITIRFAT